MKIKGYIHCPFNLAATRRLNLRREHSAPVTYIKNANQSLTNQRN
jgi:hypothetical protein